MPFASNSQDIHQHEAGLEMEKPRIDSRIQKRDEGIPTEVIPQTQNSCTSPLALTGLSRGLRSMLVGGSDLREFQMNFIHRHLAFLASAIQHCCLEEGPENWLLVVDQVLITRQILNNKHSKSILFCEHLPRMIVRF